MKKNNVLKICVGIFTLVFFTMSVNSCKSAKSKDAAAAVSETASNAASSMADAANNAASATKDAVADATDAVADAVMPDDGEDAFVQIST